MWNLRDPMGRQKIDENFLTWRERIRVWAYFNALTLVFIFILFFFTWTLMIALAIHGDISK